MKLACVWVVVAVLGCSKKKQDAVVSSEPPPPTAQQASPPAPAPAQEEPAPLPKLADNAPQDQPKTGRHTPEQEQRIAELSKQAMAKFPDAKARFNRGLPQRIYCDNGSEFVGATMDLWAYTNEVILDFSRRASA